MALSARASLRDFIAGELLPHELRPGSEVETVYQIWNRDSLKEVAWTHRYMLIKYIYLCTVVQF